MDRRKSIKMLGITTAAPEMLLKVSDRSVEDFGLKDKSKDKQRGQNTPIYRSPWQEWPDMDWAGPEYWGNRLQDWRIRDHKVECVVRGHDRTLYSLPCMLSDKKASIEMSTIIEFIDFGSKKSDQNYIGFRFGVKDVNGTKDYRSAVVYGKGINAGITETGRLFYSNKLGNKRMELDQKVRLVFTATFKSNNYEVKIAVYNINNELLDELIVETVPADYLTGSIALVCHSEAQIRENVGFPVYRATSKEMNTPIASFSEWIIQGSKLDYNPDRKYGPICFSQYTIHEKILKLTTQLAPIEKISGCEISLEVQRGGIWNTIQKGEIDLVGRYVNFRIEDWTYSSKMPYRIKLTIPLKSNKEVHYYEGTIASQPSAGNSLKVGVFSCNCDFGFPDGEVVENANKHHPDMAVFLGDQFYESHGGFGVQVAPFDSACLDYLRKWYMFGWSYRDLFRHIPCAIMSDDHDMYHGNLWGSGGRHASSDKGWAAVAQDQGGYKMEPEWVNMVQRSQTSHLPDAYDPKPVEQGIGVYYTDWTYGGISFAILEDRKFKSAPKNVLPKEANVVNGFIQNPDFDIKKHREIDADLLGERQMHFLEKWSSDWRSGVQMKVVLSQTNFCTIATLPKGTMGDEIVPSLAIPDKGEYVLGDAPTVDMDSNGWPQKERDNVLKTIRKCFAFHIAGDQHLASVAHYGVDDFGDAGVVFTGPALNNIWPRRWWPSNDIKKEIKSLAKGLDYTGNYFDGFGNRMTVQAVANPCKTNREPSILYDRGTGYGMVIINSGKRTIKTECWPRYVDPVTQPHGQYKGWPIVVSQDENYGRSALAWLPEIEVLGLNNPVVEIIEQKTGEVIYTLRISGSKFKPKVFDEGKYTIKISEPDLSISKERRDIPAFKSNEDIISFSF